MNTNKYSLKIMLFRALTVSYTAFLGVFCKEYVTDPNLQHAFSAALPTAVQGLLAGFGVDQLIYHYLNVTPPTK